MTNPKGSTFERLMADYFKDKWSKFIDRKVRTGARDTGDISNFYVGDHLVVIECKAEKKINLGGWLSEAESEARNAGALCGIVSAKRKGKGQPQDQWIIMTSESFLNILSAATDG